MMGRGSESQPSPRAETLAADLRESIESFEPDAGSEQAVYAQLLTLADELRDDREIRLLESHQGLPTILWTVLVIGGMFHDSFHFSLRGGAPEVSPAIHSSADGRSCPGSLHDLPCRVPVYGQCKGRARCVRDGAARD